MSSTSVLFDIVDGVATLTLNEAARMNPLTPGLQQGCLQALDRVRGDVPLRALIMTGSGKAFCSGADLHGLDSSIAEDPSRSVGQVIGDMMEQTGNPIVTGLRSLEVPVVSLVNGAAAGGGVGLALAADIVIAARSAYFYLPFAPSLGLVPDLGTSWLLPRAIGRARAIGLTLLGTRLSAQEAAEWGLIWSCVDDGDLAVQGLSIARRLARLPAHAVKEVRELYRQSEIHSIDQQLAHERERQMRLAELPSFAEGVRAFKEKREPRFQGPT